MKIIKNRLIPFPGFLAINLFGVLFVRKEYSHQLSKYAINHEQIHTAQMKELLYIGFYILYFLEWFIKLFKYGFKAYRNISFEREAFNNEYNLGYLLNRKPYSWTKYILWHQTY